MLTDDELREWRASLGNAITGPWKVTREREVLGRGDINTPVCDAFDADDAIYIARCDPQTIGDLIDEVLEFRSIHTIKNALRSRVKEEADIVQSGLRNAALDEAAEQVRMMLFDSQCPSGNQENAVRTILALKMKGRTDA